MQKHTIVLLQLQHYGYISPAEVQAVYHTLCAEWSIKNAILWKRRELWRSWPKCHQTQLRSTWKASSWGQILIPHHFAQAHQARGEHRWTSWYAKILSGLNPSSLCSFIVAFICTKKFALDVFYITYRWFDLQRTTTVWVVFVAESFTASKVTADIRVA